MSLCVINTPIIKKEERSLESILKAIDTESEEDQKTKQILHKIDTFN